MHRTRIAIPSLLSLVTAAAVFAVVSLETAGPAGAAGAGEMCGGIAAIRCDEGLYCEMTANPNCRMPDQSGECAVSPKVCTREYKPVCGCDGVTYGNDCERRAQAASKAHEGACR